MEGQTEMGENMNYPDNPIDFIKQYSFSDKQKVYTNGSELISVFRAGQMIEHYMSDLTPQQIKDMQFCLREKSRECAELRRELQELKERDTAKTPKIHKNKHSNAYTCPNCNLVLINKDETGWFCGKHYKFCPDCGQRIRWED